MRQGGEFLVDTRTANTQWDPAIAGNSSGNFVIAWTSDYQDGDDYGIFAQRYALAGQVEVSISDASIAEGTGGTSTATLTVTLSKASTETITVVYSTVEGTATSDDFTMIPETTLTFTPGETSKTFMVEIAGDVLDEANETFSVVLSNATAAAIGDATGTVRILNDDSRISVADADAIVRPVSGKTAVNFVVALSRASELPITVYYQTADGSAVAGKATMSPNPVR